MDFSEDILIKEGNWNDWIWLVIVGAILAFGCAWSIGANDVYVLYLRVVNT